MAVTKVRYPLDKTGKAVTNLVLNETRAVDHELNRAWAPQAGAFYGDSLVMRNADTGAKLYVGTDYVLLYPDPENTAKLGKPVYSLVSLINKSIINVSYDYQVVGGDISFSIPAIAKMLTDLQQDSRVVSWDNIWGKPVTFQPSPHLHDASTDLVGMEYLVLGLEELSRVIAQGDVASHDMLYDYINRVLAELKALEKKQQDDYDEHQRQLDALVARCIDLQNQITANKATMDAHIARVNNPHAVTKLQVGLGLVDNFPTASQTQAQTGTDNATFMTPLRTWQEIAQYSSLNIMPVINAHIADKNNPHQTTQAQVGLGLVANYAPSTQAQAEAGTDNATYPTPLRVAQYSTAKVMPVINAHIARVDNPHNTTKAQVGLGNVDNFPTASQGAAQAGTDNASFTTPLRVAQYAATAIIPQLNSHINNRNNPHGVTQSQVGLGSVANFPVASYAEAVAGTAADRYLTPQGATGLFQRLASLDDGMTGTQYNPPLYGTSGGGAQQRRMYILAGADFDRILDSDLSIYMGSGDRQYYYVYVGGDGIGNSQVFYRDCGNGGRNSGSWTMTGLRIPAVGKGNHNYIYLTTTTNRGVNVNTSGSYVSLAKVGGNIIQLG